MRSSISRPVLGLGAAGARLDVEEGVVRVHLAREHAPELELVDLLAHAFDVGLDGARRRLVLFALGQLEQLAGLAEARAQLVEHVDDALELGAFAAEFLGALGLGPDGGVLEFAQDLGQPFAALVVVKDTP